MLGPLFIGYLVASSVASFADTSGGKLKRIASNQPFHKTAHSLLDEMKEYYKGMDCVIDTAVNKLNQSVFNDLDDNQRWAGIMVNIYSSPEKIKNDTEIIIHRKLNQELLKSNPAKLWMRLGNALETALTIIGEKSYPYLYRGEPYTYKEKLVEQLTTKRFYSTTIDPSEIKHFGGNNGIFYLILNAAGTDIHEFSDVPSEREVLMKPSKHFGLISYKTNAKEIAIELSRIKHHEFKSEEFHPQVLVVLQVSQANRIQYNLSVRIFFIISCTILSSRLFS